MFCVLKDHKYTLIVKDDLLQPNDIDMIHLTTQLYINSDFIYGPTAISRTAD